MYVITNKFIVLKIIANHNSQSHVTFIMTILSLNTLVQQVIIFDLYLIQLHFGSHILIVLPSANSMISSNKTSDGIVQLLQFIGHNSKL